MEQLEEQKSILEKDIQERITQIVNGEQALRQMKDALLIQPGRLIEITGLLSESNRSETDT